MRGTPRLFDSFAGGLNSAAAPYEVKPNEARDLLNVVGTDRGGVRKRDGSLAFTGAGSPVAPLGVYAARTLGGFITTGASKIQRVTPAGAVSDLKTAVNATARWDWTEAAAVGGQGPLYGVNGVDPPQQWDGIAATSSNWTTVSTPHPESGEPRLAAVPNGKYMTVWDNRIWITGVPGDPSALYWSDIGEPNSWPVSNITRFDPNDRGAITGMTVCGSYLLVFKATKIFTVFDSDTSENRPLSDNLGTISPRALIDTPSGCMFLAPDGLYLTDGNTTLKKLTDKVQPTLDAIVPSQRRFAAGAYHRHHYYLSFSTGGAGPNLTLDYDFEQQSFWLHSNVCGHQWAVQDVGNGEELFCAAPAKLLRAFVPGELRDDGQDFLSYWASAFHHFGAPALRKHVRQIHFDGFGYVELYVNRDFKTGEELEGLMDFAGLDGNWEDASFGQWGIEDGTVWAGSGPVEELIVYTLGVARAWALKIGNEANRPFEIDSYTMSLTWRRD